jgi:cytochrome c
MRTRIEPARSRSLTSSLIADAAPRRAATLLAGALALGCGGVKGATEVEMGNGRNQAGTGALIYERSCQSCHGDHGQGSENAPAVLGKKRLAKRFKNAQKLWDYVAKEMPKDDPGSLDIGQYWNVVTFLVATTGQNIPDERLSESNADTVHLK